MRRTLAIALLAALALPLAGAQADDGNAHCERGADAATFTNPEGGKLTVKHQAGTITLGTGAADQGVLVSTTGTIDVQVKHSCMKILHLVVKNGSSTIHDSMNEVACDDDLTFTQSVDVGVDGGEFTFSLDGSLTCDGRPIKGDGHGHYVADPPLRGPVLRRELQI